ncbi:L-seryl-tRNA(Sec) selenium transferase [Actinocatenispora thailandica]|uniref:L-seryl-tRNA(Sec) selenium transferase n=1 Tax=Actinocatenispora thailandica TaxID=227318 RepID=A0A7R7DM77_9ACTN|nr:L-seryl-tRNA(Sec) selenium transferase [Actinocatenispora thailandica]BCJ34136.1 L-seryl-tRNA(Sec) selenium transferase [Actinocatenispora thailandica]
MTAHRDPTAPEPTTTHGDRAAGAPTTTVAAPNAAGTRRRVPRTDVLLADPAIARRVADLGRDLVKATVTEMQQRCRDGAIAPESVPAAVLDALPPRAATGRPVVNATGVLLHTNLGRAPLSAAARAAVAASCGTGDLELDLRTGRRGVRGAGTLAALRAAVPVAQAALVVNNNAAAVVLAATALAAGREIVLSRGELVQIGDGFRLPDLLASTGARLHEVGTTNWTSAEDYRAAVGPDAGLIVKLHRSNFTISGFTAEAGIGELAGLGVPVLADLGSGLLVPHPLLPDEPDATTALREGADVVCFSADKLLGGPQAGVLLGNAATLDRLRRHPLYRALRADKMTLAALEATLRGPAPPVAAALDADPADRMRRATALAHLLRASGIEAAAERSDGVVGGGSAPGVRLVSGAVRLPTRYGELLRGGDPAVLGRVADDGCLLDVLAVDPADDRLLADAVLAVARCR